MMHPAIEQAMATGYPTSDYLAHERQAVDDHPVEDIFGSEICADDTYFKDENGQVILLENMRDYLTDVVGAVFYEAK